MIVYVVGAQPVPDRELPVHAEIDNADANGGAEMVEVEFVEVQMEDINEEVVQMDQVLINDDNIEFIEVRMDEVLMDDNEVVPGGEDMVDNNEGMQLEIDILLQGVDEEFEPIPPGVLVEQPRGRAPMIDRPAGVQHPLPEKYYIRALNAVCRDCGACHFPIESTRQGGFYTCCNSGLVTVTGERVLQPAPVLLMNLLTLIQGKPGALELRFEATTTVCHSLRSPVFSYFNPRRLPGCGLRVFYAQGQVYHRTNIDDYL